MAKRFRTTSLTAKYQYDTRTARYVDAHTKRFVKQNAVLGALEKQVTYAKRNITRIGNQLRDGKIDLETWRAGMVKQVKTVHTVQYVVGQGGWARMTQSDYGRIGNVLKAQYKYLNGFVKDIQATFKGPSELDGRFLNRSQMYAQSSISTFQESRRLAQHKAGMRYERRVLNIAEHCASCVNAAAQGWQPIFTLPAIGDSECNIGCKCHFEYRKSLID